MHKTFCDLCERDITKHDRIDIRLDPGRRNVLKRAYGHWDICITCARTMDINKLIDEPPDE